MNHRTALAVGLLTVSSVFVGCKSEKEIGAELVDKKLDLVEGATGELSKRGNDVGRNAAKAIGDTLKGVGSGVKDALMPELSVTVPAELSALGLKAVSANLQDGHQARVVLQGTQPFQGGLWLEATGSDAGHVGRAVGFLHRELSLTAPTEVVFPFEAAERLSNATTYVLHPSPPMHVVSKEPNLKVNQLSVEGSTVKVYGMFEKAFTGTVELKVLDAQGGEVGRASEPGGDQARLDDSAQFITFVLGPETDWSRVSGFEVRVRLAPKAGKKP